MSDQGSDQVSTRQADRRDPLRRIAEFAADVTGLAHGTIVFVDGPARRLLAGTEIDRPPLLEHLDEQVARTGEPLVLGDTATMADDGAAVPISASRFVIRPGW